MRAIGTKQCSNLEIDENFRISHNLGLGLAAKISQAFAIQPRSLSRPKHTPPNCPPPKESLFGVFPCTLRRTCGVDIGYISHILVWRRVPFFRALYFRESLFLMHKCLNRDHHSCDKPLKAKVFFILYPSRFPVLLPVGYRGVVRILWI